MSATVTDRDRELAEDATTYGLGFPAQGGWLTSQVAQAIAAERERVFKATVEACARIADAAGAEWWGDYQKSYLSEDEHYSDAADMLGDRIRALKLGDLP
jgi:hypothetical protein